MELFREEEAKHLVVDETGRAYLLETARWGKFLGLVYATILGLLTFLFPLMLSLAPADYQQVPASFLILWLLIAIGINFYPLYAIIKSAILTKSAIHTLDQYKFNKSLRLTKNMYMYIGVLTIIMIIFYGIFIIFIATMAATATAVS